MVAYSAAGRGAALPTILTDGRGMTIELYTANTPNSQRVTVVLEELGLPYSQTKIDIFSGGAKTAEFRKVNPLAKRRSSFTWSE